MIELSSLPIFFLGANNVSGYVSRFGDCFNTNEGWQVWVLKGGPGSGKSTLMKKAAARLLEKGHSVWLAPCPADPNSLDAVISESRKLMLLDGTAPHPMEPPLAGISGRILDTGQFWNSRILQKSRERIGALAAENSRLHSRAASYTAAASRLLGESRRIAEQYTDREKAVAFGKAIAKKHIPQSKSRPTEQVRFLSSVTPLGVVYYRSSAQKICPQILEIEDNYGAAAGIILDTIRKEAVDRGHFVINCRCPLRPLDKTDHILLPDLGFGVCTVNRYLASSETEIRKIHYQRFTQKEGLQSHRHHLTFNRKGAKELLDCAVGLLADAKRVHDMLEQYYAEAMDFEALEDYTDNLLTEI